jgi:2-polyprenyl-3-methyl-5-hydroxy-6-metoxy-1,4-benzoquinol methylase
VVQHFSPFVSHYTWKHDTYSSHSIVLNWLQQFPPTTKILDIGCADGKLGYYLGRDKRFLTGIEPNATWACLAETYYDRVINAPLTEVEEHLLSGYDVVILMDVLEHMADPYQELARLSRNLSAQSYVVISVPNIAHLYIRLSLLFGRFNYTQRGILDKTHLRFFTLSSLKKMIIDSGLTIHQTHVTPVPLPILHSFFAKTNLGHLSHTLNERVTRIFPTLLGYQFVIFARPNFE